MTSNAKGWGKRGSGLHGGYGSFKGFRAPSKGFRAISGVMIYGGFHKFGVLSKGFRASYVGLIHR